MSSKFNRLKSFFYRKSKSKTTSIFSVNAITKIPNRSIFKGDKGKLDLIEDYKREYTRILTTKDRTITTVHLDLGNFREDMDMYTRLVIDSCVENKNPRIIENTKTQNLLKLDLYKIDIDSLYDNATARLIALSELRHNLFIPIRNRRTLKDEIDNLHSNLIAITNQKVGIEKTIDAYKTDAILGSDDDNSYSIAHNNIYLKNVLFPSIFYERKVPKFIHEQNTIAWMEKELEIYTYKHKNEIDILFQDLSTIYETEMTSENKPYLLQKLNHIEAKFIAFYHYGKDIITYEDIQNLYRVKFEILTCDINSLNYSPIPSNTREKYLIKTSSGKTQALEIACYRDIVLNKIMDIQTLKNGNIELIFQDKFKDAIKPICDYLKNTSRYQDNKYRIDDILDDPIRLAFILALDKEDGLVKFFKERCISPHDSYEDEDVINNGYKDLIDLTNSRNDVIEWDDKLPLETVLAFAHKPHKLNGEEIPFPLLDIFNLWESVQKKDENTFYLPEGIKRINCEKATILDNRDRLTVHPIISSINQNAKGKSVIFPSSLREINGNPFARENVTSIVFNDGLEKVENFIISKEFTEINIPSTLKEVKNLVVEGITDEEIRPIFRKPFTISFDNFEESYLLHHPKKLYSFIQNFYEKASVVTKSKLTSIRLNNKFEILSKDLLYINLPKLEILPAEWTDNLLGIVMTIRKAILEKTGHDILENLQDFDLEERTKTLEKN